MDLDFVSVHKLAKKELGQYPAILTSLLVNDPYILNTSMLTSLPFSDSCSAYPVILGNDNVTRFSLPLGVNFTVPGDPTWEEPHPDDDPPVWCLGESAASYLELNFTVPYKICAIETQGVQTPNNDIKYVSSYLIEVFEVSANCSEWKFYNGSRNITVSFLESSGCCVV